MRSVFEDEIQAILRENQIPSEKQILTAAHLLQIFTFQRSTPSPHIQRLLHDAFFRCTANSLSIVSTNGRQYASKTRIYDSEVAKFCPMLPMVPASVMNTCHLLMNELVEMGHLRDVTVEDIEEEISKQPLVPELFFTFAQWCIKKRDRLAPLALQRLKNAVIVQQDDMIVSLAEIQHAIVPKTVPLDLPIAPNTLPLTLSRRFANNDLRATFG